MKNDCEKCKSGIVFKGKCNNPICNYYAMEELGICKNCQEKDLKSNSTCGCFCHKNIIK